MKSSGIRDRNWARIAAASAAPSVPKSTLTPILQELLSKLRKMETSERGERKGKRGEDEPLRSLFEKSLGGSATFLSAFSNPNDKYKTNK